MISMILRSWIILLLALYFLVTTSSKVMAEDTLTVAYAEAAPFILKDGEHLHGPSFWLWNQVSQNLDQPYVLKEMSFTDILNGLANGSVDLSINPLTITSERAHQFRFTLPFYTAYGIACVRDGEEMSPLLAFIKSLFSPTFLKGMALLISVIFVFGLLTWFIERKNNPTQFRPGIPGIFDGLWWSAVTVTTVGYGDKAPKSHLGKLIALVWMFVAIIFISSLTASIASSLTMTRISRTKAELEDFKNKEVGTVEASGTMTYLQGHFFKKIRSYATLKEGLADLKKGSIDAFMYDEPILQYRVQTEPEHKSVSITHFRFNTQHYAWGFSNNQAILKDEITRKMLRILESADWEKALFEYKLKAL